MQYTAQVGIGDSRPGQGTVAAGTPPSLQQLASDLGPRIYHVALRVLGNDTDAEDAVQQAFTDALRGAAGFRGEASPSTWMWRVAHHAIQKVLRRRARKEVQLVPLSTLGPDGDTPCTEAGLEETVDRARLVALTMRCLDALPASEREILALRDLEGMPVRDVAHSLDISIAAARSRVHRARLALRAAVRRSATAQGGESP